MEATYRLIISALAVPWKAYNMSTDEYLFPYLLTRDQECFWMTCFYSLMSIANTIYHSGGSLLRYWYVKASHRPEGVEVFMRTKTFCLRLYFAFTNASFIYCSFSWVRSPAVRPRNLVPRPLGDAPGLCR